ncbi:MAG: FG-GAP repeat-containing protein [Bacteroidetes bacterium]|nr:MAG: FG-GAP repeat-containing protein [Bacteroidota bacterium]
MNAFRLIPVLLLAINISYAQPGFVRVDSVPVTNTSQLIYPWAGGLNFCQFSEIDLDMDGIQDLFVFDRTGNKVVTFLNQGTANQVDYVHAPQYQALFPSDLHDWVLLRDYDCDGKADIFTYQSPGMRVFRNTSSVANGLQFTLRYNLIYSDYNPTGTPNNVNLYVSLVDIPAIRDIDNDGDLDILTFSILGNFIEHHINMTVENGVGCQDTIQFDLGSYCWGNFAENSLNASIALNQSCRIAAPSPNESLQNSPSPPDLLHAGSCIECIDIDSDNDKEVLLGDISYNGVTMVRNGGTPASANMDSVDAVYPSYSTTVMQNIFNCGYQVDINNDNKKDLLFSPNVSNAAENFHSIWYYENLYATDSTRVSFQQNDFLQANMIEVGEGAYPVFFDYDNDGDKDLFVGNYGYYNSGLYHSKIALYKNTGNASNPAFTLQTTDFAGIFASGSGLLNIAITFGDLDGDGDKDMLIGDYNGKLHYYQKQAGNPDNFILAQANYQGIDIGSFANPQLIDVDRDGKLDLLIGRQNGFVSYYNNIGTSSSPNFALTTQTFGGIDVRAPFYSTGYSAPFMYDEGGSYKMIVGSESGYLWKFDNIDGNLAGTFNLVDSTYLGLREGSRTYLNGGDLNNDGLMDLALGNYSGGVSLFYGDNNVSTGSLVAADDAGFELYPNPASASVTVNIPGFSVFSDIRLVMYNAVGQQVLSQPVNMQRTTLNLDGFAKGMYICAVEINGKKSHRKLILQR